MWPMLAALPWWRIGAAAAVVGGLLWWRHAAVLDERAACDARNAEAVAKRREEVAEFTLHSSAITQRAVEALLLERSRIGLETNELKGRKNEFIPPAADRACIVGAGFVLYHDAAWSGAALPEKPGDDVGRNSGVPLSGVADAIADNAGACRQLRAEVVAWRDWYTKQQAEWAAFARRAEGQSTQEHQQPKGR